MTDNDIQTMFEQRDRAEPAEADRIDCLIDNALRKQFSERQRGAKVVPKVNDDLLRRKPVMVDQHGNDIYPPKLCNWIEDACRLLRGAPLLDGDQDRNDK